MNTITPSTCAFPPTPPARPKTVLIVDDELPALANLEWSLARRPQWRLLAPCRSSEQAREQLRRAPADLILLDIQMPGQSGLEFARELCQGPAAPLIVFVTAYDEHALSAFDVFALDYVLKPYDDERFDLMLKRAAQTLELNQQAAMNGALLDYLRDRAAEVAGHGAPLLQQLVVRTAGGLERVAVDDIVWIGTAGNYVELHLAARRVLHRTTITAIAARLSAQDFVRVHRTALVRRSAIAGLRSESDGSYTLRLAQGDSVRVSTSYLKQVQAMFA
ncbi:LytR/AlgR family response regulator transcription factor [Rugamonas sp. CCM 8940]|uniref:LytR/AlgR family response regulator transcription factor n=1 Tax=Rugamonas sp. CCM 8940 TaxID=2765359 RepID=UPI0018F73930|nr:LytTR family DNA-binding domain-containing protein [Rugamonas sp. CCM 8940]MBJ7312772.1 response regulator transcription factor [Rugamonas sp. CCM 8940]